MNYTSTGFAALLLAAPVCMVAQADTAEDFVQQSLDTLNALAAILEKATPDNVDECSAEVLELAPKFAAIKELENQLSEEDRKALMGDSEATQKCVAAMMRLMAATQKLQAMMSSATPEEQAKLQKLAEAFSTLSIER